MVETLEVINLTERLDNHGRSHGANLLRPTRPFCLARYYTEPRPVQGGYVTVGLAARYSSRQVSHWR